MKTVNVSISLKSIFNIILIPTVILALVSFYQILVIVFLGFIVSTFYDYVCNVLFNLYKWNKKVISVILFFLSLLILGGVFIFLTPSMVDQGSYLVRIFINNLLKLDLYLKNNGLNFDLGLQNLESLTSGITNFSQNILSFLLEYIKVLGLFFLVFTIAFYINIDQKSFYNIIKLFLGNEKRKDRVDIIIEKVNVLIGNWIMIRFIKASLMFVFTMIIFFSLDISYPLFFSTIVALSEFIPIIGNIFSYIIMLIFAFIKSTLIGLLVLICLIFITIIRHIFIDPVLSINQPKLNPLLVIFTSLSFLIIFGYIGILVSTPFILIIYTIKENLKKFIRKESKII